MDQFPSREREAAATLAPRVSAIVVARNVRTNASGQSAFDLCLRSALAEPWIDDLVVVDHNCPAPIASALREMKADRRDVTLVVAAPEMSSAAAANLGAAQACGRWLLFLDPHVVLQRGAVERMAAAGGGAHTPWIVGGRLTDTEGRERCAARAGALNAWSAIAVALNWPGPRRKRRRADEPARVGAVSGAFMLVLRHDFQTLGGFDAGFVSDGADLDLCRRAVAAGGGVLFQPAAAGVQFEHAAPRGRRQAQGLALFAAKSANTSVERAFAVVARPALMVLLGLRDFVAGRPPLPR